jgi:hypothetical protein
MCSYVRMTEIENSWTDLDEIWYGHYVIGVYPKIVLFNVLQSAVTAWRTKERTNLEGGIDTSFKFGMAMQ